MHKKLITTMLLVATIGALYGAPTPLYNKSLSGFHDALFDQGKAIKKSHIMVGFASSLQLMPSYYTHSPNAPAFFPTGLAPIPAYYAGFALWYGLQINGEFGFLATLGTPILPISFSNAFLPLGLTFSFKKTLHEKNRFAIAFKVNAGANIYFPLQHPEFLSSFSLALSLPLTLYLKKVALSASPFVEGNTMIGNYLSTKRFIQVITPGLDLGVIFPVGKKKKTWLFISLDFAADVEITANPLTPTKTPDTNGCFNIGLNFGCFYMTK